MKRILKLIFIFSIVMLLTGCGWNDVKNISNFECKYLAESTSNLEIKNIIFAKTDEKIFAAYNEKNFTLLDSDDNKNFNHEFNSSININYSKNDMKNFASDYYNSKKCPTNIYLSKKNESSKSYTFSIEKCVESTKYCYKYNLDSDSSTKVLSPFVGTCTCLDPMNFTTINLSCEDYYQGSKVEESDFPFGVCYEICSTGGGGRQWYWYGDKDENIKNFIAQCDSDNVSCKPTDSSLTNDCSLRSSTPNKPQNNSCANPDYTKTDCDNISGKWNEETSCCEIEEKCWFHIPSGFSSEGGYLYWQTNSPCKEEKNNIYPNQRCEERNLSKDQCITTETPIYGGDLSDQEKENKQNQDVNIDVDWEIGGDDSTCREAIGENIYNIIHGAIFAIRIIGAIIVLVNAMMILIPPIANGDAAALKKSGKKCMYLAIILALIGVFPTLIKLIGTITGLDTTCIL